MSVDTNDPAARSHDAANDVDERGFARAVRSEKREDLAAPNLETHVRERVEPRCVDLGESGDGQNGERRDGHCAWWSPRSATESMRTRLTHCPAWPAKISSIGTCFGAVGWE